MAPGLTIGLVRPSGVRSIAVTALNGSPVAFTPSRSRAPVAPITSQTSAKTKGFDTLMIAKAWSASPTAWTAPSVPTTQMPKRSAGTRASAG